MALFGNKAKNQNISERDLLLSKYHSGRHNLLLVVVFSAINLIMLLTNSGSYFLFSAYVPYFLGDLGMYQCGKYPAEVYGEDFASMEFSDISFLIVAVAIAAVVIGVYLLCWILAKKMKVGFIVFGLVMFAVDTAFFLLLFGINTEMILDIVFHAWVLISLVNAIVAYNKLKKLPPEEVAAEVQPEAAAQPTATLNGESIE